MSRQPDGGGGRFAPMGIGDLIGKAFQIYGNYWQQLLPIAAVIILPLTILSYLFVDLLIIGAQATSPGDITTLEEAAAAAQAVKGMVIAGMIGSVLTSALFLILTYLLQGAVTRGAALAIAGDAASAATELRYGLKRVGSLIWIAILAGLIAGFAPFAAAVVLALVVPALTSLWVLAATVAMLFLGVMLAVAVPALVVENRRGTDALTRSWELVRTHFWHVLGALVVSGLIAVLASLVISLLFGFGPYWVRGIGSAVAYTVTLPFSAIVLVLVYVDLRARRENLSPEQLLGELQASA